MKLLTTSEAAKFLGLSKQSLEKWRHYGRGPKFIKCGRRVKYSLTALESWCADREVSSTSEAAALDATGPGRA